MGIERVFIDFTAGTVEVFGPQQISTQRRQSPHVQPSGQGRFPTLDRPTRKAPAKDVGIPAGTIDSLRPLIQTAFSQYGLEQDYAYWQQLSDNARYDTSEACTLLDQANKGPLAAAKAVLHAEPQTKRMIDFGDIPKENLGYITATLAREIVGHYPQENQDKWLAQILEYENELQPQKV